eukprot:462248_1
MLSSDVKMTSSMKSFGLIISVIFSILFFQCNGCNYIKLDGIPYPENICQEYNEAINRSPILQLFNSWNFQCNGSDTMIRNEYFCNTLTNFCTLSACSNSYFSGSKNYTDNIICSTSSICDYIQYIYYDEYHSANMVYEEDIISMVINECIDKIMYGCNSTNFWRVQYNDNECNNSQSIYFYPISNEPYTYPKQYVVECTSSSTPPIIPSSADDSGFTEWFNENEVAISIGLSCLGVFILLIVAICVVKCKRKRNKEYVKNEGNKQQLSLLNVDSTKDSYV